MTSNYTDGKVSQNPDEKHVHQHELSMSFCSSHRIKHFIFFQNLIYRFHIIRHSVFEVSWPGKVYSLNGYQRYTINCMLKRKFG